MKQYINTDCLTYFIEQIKQNIDKKIELRAHKNTTCPNCGAVITSNRCEYCGTDFEQVMLWQ